MGKVDMAKLGVGKARFVSVCALGLLLMLQGCAALRAASARQKYIHGQTQQHQYQQPIDSVWPKARQMLFEKGYTVRDTGEGGTYTAETEWKTDGKARSRYLITGVKHGDHSQVQFVRAEESLFDGKWDSDGTERDLDLEFQLIKRVEPDAAQRIESEAELEAEKAKEG